MSDDTLGKHFSSSRIERAWEPPEEVVITRALAESPLLDYDDYGPLIRLLLRDPDQPTNVPDLMKEFQASGWSVGEKPLRRIMRRLKEAGHVSHGREYNPVTQRPEWVFRVYRNPANNPQYTEDGVTALSQVTPIGPIRPDRESDPSADRAESAVYAGQADRADSAGSESIGPNQPDRKQQVSAGQSERAKSARSLPSPPHPPEEVTTSSPNPLSSTSGTTSVPSPREGEEGGFADEDLRAARDVLEELPTPWTQGRLNSQKLAPKLLAVMADQGWPTIREVNRGLLTQQLTKNPRGMTNPYRLLDSDRIPNLPRYSVVAAEAALMFEGEAGSGMCPKHPRYRAGSRCVPCAMA
ncbi:hypothetical protein ACWEPZ_29305 [Streptomyces sp. NPDC004288]